MVRLKVSSVGAFKSFSHLFVFALVVYNSGLNNGPDRLEKDLGTLSATNPEAAEQDWYSQSVIKISNVYRFYGAFINLLDRLPVHIETLRLISFLLLQLFSYFLVISISKKLTNDIRPGQLYAATICLLPDFWVNPEFLGYDGGLSPRAISTTLLLLSIKFALDNRFPAAFITSGIASLFHPSHGLLVFFLTAGVWLVTQIGHTKLFQFAKEFSVNSAMFLLSGGLFPLLLALNMDLDLGTVQYQFHASLVTYFRHPFMPVDLSKIIYVLIFGLTIFITLQHNQSGKDLKIKVRALSSISLFLILLFWVGVECRIWYLVSTFAFRLESVITLFAILLFYDSFLRLASARFSKNTTFVLSFLLVFILCLNKFDFSSPASRVTFKQNFFSGTASTEELKYAWKTPRCYITPPGIQFPFSIVQFKVIGFSPSTGILWFNRLKLVSNVDLEKRFAKNGKFNISNMTEVQQVLNDGFSSLKIDDVKNIISETGCRNFFLPLEFRYLKNDWGLTPYADGPPGFYKFNGRV